MHTSCSSRFLHSSECFSPRQLATPTTPPTAVPICDTGSGSCPLLLQHHDSHKFNFAAAAKEEMHDVAVHPPTPHLVGKKSGVEAIDKASWYQRSQGSTESKCTCSGGQQLVFYPRSVKLEGVACIDPWEQVTVILNIAGKGAGAEGSSHL